MKKLEIFQTSVVVTADSHNPTILHPSFLTSEKIVPKGLELAEDHVSTPVGSVVKYTNNLVFTVDTSKFQLVDNSPPKANSLVPGCSSRYIRKLPYVQYTNVGINFRGFIECADAHSLVTERFLKPGPWNKGELSLQGFGLRFAYEVKNALLQLQCEPASVQVGEGEPARHGIALAGNYNTELPKDHPLPNAERAIKRFGERARHFCQVADIVLGVQDK